MEEVLVPHVGGILSALGLAIADLRRDYVRPLMAMLSDADFGEVERAFTEMEATARRDLREPHLARFIDARYAGQSFELSVDAGDLDMLERRFHGAHEQRYGYRSDDAAIETIGLRLTATVERPKPMLRADRSPEEAATATRSAYFDREVIDTPVVARDRMGAGAIVTGPAIVEFRESTCVVRPGWRGEIDDVGTLILNMVP